MRKKNSLIVIYTDGSCLGSPGTGGWAAFFFSGKDRWLISGAKTDTYSLEMEIQAITEALRHLREPSNIIIYCDCKPLVRNLNSRIFDWKSDGFVNDRFAKSYREVCDEIERHKKVYFRWVKAHAGNVYNEKVDFYARLAAEHLNSVVNNTKPKKKFYKLNQPENYIL